MVEKHRKVHYDAGNWVRADAQGLGSVYGCRAALVANRRKDGSLEMATLTTDAAKVTCKVCLANLARSVTRVIDTQIAWSDFITKVSRA